VESEAFATVTEQWRLAQAAQDTDYANGEMARYQQQLSQYRQVRKGGGGGGHGCEKQLVFLTRFSLLSRSQVFERFTSEARVWDQAFDTYEAAESNFYESFCP
jgi:hypothetical protein